VSRLSSWRACAWALLLLAACGGSSGDSSNGPGPIDEGVMPTAGCRDGSLGDSNGLYRVCFPETWNGSLVIYAHGYVSADQPLAVRDDQVGGQSASQIVTGLGYGFAAASYRRNGLVAADAVEDLAVLVDTVRRHYSPDPNRVYVLGVSEGGLVSALFAERHAERSTGALAICGPVGSFTAQIDYFGDFRVVFDYFYPEVIPGSPVDIPDSVRALWDSRYAPAVGAALATNPEAAQQLLAVTGAAADLGNPFTVGATVLGVLWYNINATADAKEQLGGQPYDNIGRVYAGSDDDGALNAGVARIAADQDARAALARYETSGALTLPVVTLHTTGDPIVPFGQEALYAEKAAQAGASSRLHQRSVARYGHCALDQSELLAAFSELTGTAASASLVVR
jgi:pimeloyl-ACP methyl ester carboxylesterase